MSKVIVVKVRAYGKEASVVLNTAATTTPEITYYNKKYQKRDGSEGEDRRLYFNETFSAKKPDGTWAKPGEKWYFSIGKGELSFFDESTAKKATTKAPDLPSDDEIPF